MADKDLETFREYLRRTSTNIEEFASTTSAINSALASFGNRLDDATKAVDGAKESLKEEQVVNKRVRTTMSMLNNTLFGIILTGKSEIAVATKRTALMNAHYNVAQQALNIQRSETGVLRAQLQSKLDETAATQERILALRESKNYSSSQLDIANREKEAVLERIDALQQSKIGIESEIAFTERDIELLTARGTLSARELTQLQQLEDRRDTLYGTLQRNADSLTRENLQRLDLTGAIVGLQKDIQKTEGLITKENFVKQSLIEESAKYAKQIEESVKKEKELEDAVADRAEALKVAQIEELNKKFDLFQNAIKKIVDRINSIATPINDLIASIRKMQQQFGISAGQAAELKFTNLVASVKSYTSALLSLGKTAGVTAEEIEKSQSSFQAEFGGVITSGAAENIARQAKEMGVGATELAKARRVFMTQTMGDTGAAKAAQDKFIGEFQKKGLTAKDAMEAIGKNSELLARNGTRFATSFARAAAEAKKIGVDLGKIDQVGDNIIGDFEGFLEKQAELGAMGFGFDTSRLAEVSETGDTGALMNELRSQLASTGKDITNLRRSEQLALSQAFGLTMEELQRMGAAKGGSGEAMTDQEKTNNFLSQIVNFFDGMGKSLAIIATVLSATVAVVHTALLTKIAMGTMKLDSIGALAKSMAPSTGTMKGVGLGAAGTLAGAGMMYGGEKLKEKGYKKTGIATSAAGAALSGASTGAMIGSIIPGVGTAIGAAVGGLIGGGLSLYNQLGDDVYSKAGYGDRTLVTPKGVVSLNNNDNIVAYADDMIAQNAGLDLLSKGAIASEAKTAPPPQVNIDFTRLEHKLDQVVRAIGSMEVTMDANKVGKIIVTSDQKAATAGVFRAQRV